MYKVIIWYGNHNGSFSTKTYFMEWINAENYRHKELTENTYSYASCIRKVRTTLKRVLQAKDGSCCPICKLKEQNENK